MGGKQRQGNEDSVDVLGVDIYGLIEQYKKTHSQEEINRLMELEPRLKESVNTLREFAGFFDVDFKLGIKGESQNQLSYLNAAEAMFSDYEVIYYINLETEDYVEYSTPNDYATLKLENSGSDFFTDLEQNIKRVVYEKDQERVTNALSKEVLLPQLENSQVFSVTYRLMIKGRPVYYCSKAIRPQPGNYMIIGICRVDSQSQYEMHLQNAQYDNINFSNIASALSSDFDRIYYVNMENDSYVRYATREKDRMIRIASAGASFFT